MYKLNYLTIPASSILAEESNSAARITFDDRYKLHSCTFKAEMCIRSWINVLDASNISWANNFHTSYEAKKNHLDELVAEDEVIDYIARDNHERNK